MLQTFVALHCGGGSLRILTGTFSCELYRFITFGVLNLTDYGVIQVGIHRSFTLVFITPGFIDLMYNVPEMDLSVGVHSLAF